MKITQSQFIERLAASLGITYSRAEEMVHAFKEFVYSELAAGNSVEFSGFGQFLVSHRDARIGVNPRKPSQRITIPS